MSPHFGHVVINLDVSDPLLVDIDVAQVPNMADLVMMVTMMRIMRKIPNIMMLMTMMTMVRFSSGLIHFGHIRQFLSSS